MLILCIRYNTAEPARYMLYIHNLLTYIAGEFMRRLQGRPEPNSDRTLQYQSYRQRQVLANVFFGVVRDFNRPQRNSSSRKLLRNLHDVVRCPSLRIITTEHQRSQLASNPGFPPDFVFSPKLQDKIRNGKPGFEHKL